MKEISEDEWEKSILKVKEDINLLLKSDDYTFEKHFDLEIIMKILEEGLKLKKDEKNNV
jgi:hypothetical protein